MFDTIESVATFAHKFIVWILINYSECFIKNNIEFSNFIKNAVITVKDKELLEKVLQENYDKLVREIWLALGKDEKWSEKREWPFESLLEIVTFILNWKKSYTHDQKKLIDFSQKKQGNQTTLLHLAAMLEYTQGFVELVEVLRATNKLSEYLALPDETGDTPLHLAVKNKRVAIISYCVANSLENESLNRARLTAIELAIKKDFIEVIEAFRKNNNKNTATETWDSFAKRDLHGKKLLSFAAEQGADNFVAFLIAKKVDFSLIVRNGNFLLGFAVRSEKLSMVKLIESQYPNLQAHRAIQIALAKIAAITQNTAITLSEKLRLDELEKIIKYLLSIKKINLPISDSNQLKKYVDMKIISSDENIERILIACRNEITKKKFRLFFGSIGVVSSSLGIFGGILLLLPEFSQVIGIELVAVVTVIMFFLAILSLKAYYTPFDKVLKFREQALTWFETINNRLHNRTTYEFSQRSEINQGEEYSTTSHINKTLKDTETALNKEVESTIIDMPKEDNLFEPRMAVTKKNEELPEVSSLADLINKEFAKTDEEEKPEFAFQI